MQIVCEAYHRYLILSNLAERHTTSIRWKTTLWCQHYIAMNFYQWTKLNCMCIYSKTILKRMSSFKNNQVYTRCGCCVTKYTYNNTTIVYKYIQHSWKTLLRSFDYKKIRQLGSGRKIKLNALVTHRIVLHDLSLSAICKTIQANSWPTEISLLYIFGNKIAIGIDVMSLICTNYVRGLQLRLEVKIRAMSRVRRVTILHITKNGF